MPRTRLGFLVCDVPLQHLADRHGDYPAMFADAFAEVSDVIDWQVYRVSEGQMAGSPAECDAWLISGSRHGAYDDLPWIEPLAAFVRAIDAAHVPCVGLCFGHQMIAHALGAPVAKSERGWGLGIHSYALESGASRAWMAPPLPEVVLPVCHQDQVLALPPGATRLAANQHCPNFIVQFSDSLLGIQGHPEFSPAFLGELVEWRRDDLPAAVYDSARSSLQRAHDNRTVKQWILQFLQLPLRAPG